MGPDEVRAKLDELSREQRESVSVCYYGRDESIFVSSKGSGASPEMRVEVACIAKPLTATLVAGAMGEKRLSLSDGVGEYLRRPGKHRLHDLKIYHLLNHSHGIDEDDLRSLPRNAHGFIDTHELLSRTVASERLFPCGSLASYGSAGYWLAAAVLETIYDVPFRTLLCSKLFEPLDVQPTFVGTCGTCPSMGGDLQLSAADLLKLTKVHLPSVESGWGDVLMELRRDDLAVAPAGWHPTIRRFCLGWDDFGSGVFGHNSNGVHDSAAVRFSPDTGEAIAVTVKNGKTAVNALRLVHGSGLQGSPPPRLPRLLSSAEWSRADASRYVGTYEAAFLKIDVDVTDSGSLRAHVYRKDERPRKGKPWIGRVLIPAEGDNFVPNPPDTEVLSLVHFSHPTSRGRYRYLQARNCVYMRREGRRTRSSKH